MIGNASSAGTSYLSMLFIGFYLSNSQAGIYSSVLAIISILMFIPRLFSQVLLPEFSNLFGSGNVKQLKNTLFVSLFFLTIIGTIALLPLYIFSYEILSLFGNSFVEGSQILRIMTPALFIRIVSVPIVTFLSSTKYVIYPNIGGVIILITSVGTWMLLTPSYQLSGIAYGYLVGTTFGIGYQITMGLIMFNKYINTIEA
jgi:O-antigen/teichoic acid export membrane protein